MIQVTIEVKQWEEEDEEDEEDVVVKGKAGDKHPFWEVVVGLVWEVWENVVEDKAKNQDCSSNSKECPMKSEQ